jgi:hypothetical protein
MPAFFHHHSNIMLTSDAIPRLMLAKFPTPLALFGGEVVVCDPDPLDVEEVEESEFALNVEEVGESEFESEAVVLAESVDAVKGGAICGAAVANAFGPVSIRPAAC